MYAVLGEDSSDVEMLNVLIKRIANDNGITVKTKGYTGCAQLLIKGAKAIQTFSNLGCSRFVICYDSDRSSPEDRYKEIMEKIVTRSGIAGNFCALVPVQEIEAWILADLNAVAKLIPSFRPSKAYPSPESINDPKEELESLCRKPNHKPLYTHSVHNPKIAHHLDLAEIARKCPSSLPLFELVQQGNGNCPTPPADTNKNRLRNALAAL